MDYNIIEKYRFYEGKVLMKNEKLSLQNIISSSITVVGIGKSNIPLLSFLLDNGAKRLTARDKKSREQLSSHIDIEKFESLGVRFILGNDYLENIDEEVIFRAPGIRPDEEHFATAVARGALLTSEMELFFALCPATILAITGSDGKTTTTTLTYKILEETAKRKDGIRVFVGGNIGAPILPRVEEMRECDFAVVELSSFQLQEMRYTPNRAIITNITPNHLNWHKDYKEYIDAKKYIIGKDTHVTLNAKNEETAKIAETVENKTVFSAYLSKDEIEKKFPSCEKVFLDNGYIVSEKDGKERKILAVSDIKLIGTHNIENFMAAYAITSLYADTCDIKKVATEFGGVEHRIEFIREYKGVKYYNSSIDSSPMRTSTTLSTIKDENNVVICGGAAKGLTFELLADVLCRKARAVVLTGATADEIEKTLLAHKDFASSGLEIYKNPIFKAAAECARDIARAGDRVILSPACTSFDAFENFEQRGNVFKDIVNGFAD